MPRALRLALAVILCHVLLLGAFGEPAWSEQQPAAEDKTDDLWTRDKLLGDIGGLRSWLEKRGAALTITETSEVLGNLTGGLRQGALYEGLTDISLRIDLSRTLDWPGIISARAYQIHGRGLSANNIGNLYPVSSIEADRTTRLSELWYEHRFETVRVRFGQLTIGDAYLNPDAANLFINSGFGWPPLPSVDLPSGGPSYPLATPGIRLRYDPRDDLTLYLTLFNGDPTGTGVGGSQLADASGTAFRTSDGAFLIGQVSYNPGNQGTYSIGGWWNSEQFRDQRFDTAGVPLASPLSNGMARQHKGNLSLFAWMQQPLRYDDAGKPALVLFARVMGAPDDRNLVSFYADAGLFDKAPFGRGDDAAGIAFGYSRIGGAARGFDRDTASFSGSGFPIRSGEAVLELTYQFQVAGWWQLQPDFQYVFNPGGSIPDPARPGRRIGDAAILGLRTTVAF